MEYYADLQGKIAIVTGASAGMGKAISEKYLQAGMKVIGTGRRKEKLESSVKELPIELQQNFVPFCGDVGRS